MIGNQPDRQGSIVADGSPLAHLEANVAEVLADVAEIGIDRGAGQNLVTGTDDFYFHNSARLTLWSARRIRSKVSAQMSR